MVSLIAGGVAGGIEGMMTVSVAERDHFSQKSVLIKSRSILSSSPKLVFS